MERISSKLLRLARLNPFPEGMPSYAFERDFIARATDQGTDTEAFRRKLVQKFSLIQKNLNCAHQESEPLILAEAIVNLKVEGPIIELGCFKGGSTAKLSLVARATHRLLYICDSFAGLPTPQPHDKVHYGCLGRVKEYTEGDYTGSLEEVKANVAAWGAIEACQFVKGYFNETLANLDIQPALIFMDVDLIESARDCIRFLWPRLKSGGRLYTHEANAETFLSGILDPNWWHQNMGSCPPLLYGAGYGFGQHALNLAHFNKD